MKIAERKKRVKALSGSLAKWKAIVAGTGADNGPDNCPCCAIWFERYCDGCPIAEAVDQVGCKGTPYDVFIDTLKDSLDERKAAEAERDFLAGLLRIEKRKLRQEQARRLK